MARGGRRDSSFHSWHHYSYRREYHSCCRGDMSDRVGRFPGWLRITRRKIKLLPPRMYTIIFQLAPRSEPGMFLTFSTRYVYIGRLFLAVFFRIQYVGHSIFLRSPCHLWCRFFSVLQFVTTELTNLCIGYSLCRQLCRALPVSLYEQEPERKDIGCAKIDVGGWKETLHVRATTTWLVEDAIFRINIIIFYLLFSPSLS